jgi:N-acetylglucosamine-6-sulfatase
LRFLQLKPGKTTGRYSIPRSWHQVRSGAQVEADPEESTNLIADSAHQGLAKKLENELYGLMGELGGMDIPLNQPLGGFNDRRLRGRGGANAAPFPSPFVVDEPLNSDAK